VEAGGERVAARKVFWAAAVQLASVAKSVGVASIALAGSMSWPTCRFPALPTSSPPATSCISTSRAERSCRALAPAAILSGRAAARNTLASIHGQPRTRLHVVGAQTDCSRCPRVVAS
jgi:hypothetical protein